MNPEEGELRPQILDRFPVCVKVETIADPDLRVEIVKRNMLYEYDSEKYSDVFQQDEKLIGEIIVRAKKLLPTVKITESHLYAISLTCAELKVDGQRPDIVMVKMAQTIAALDNRQMVSEADILLAAELALAHRTRDGGLLEPPTLDEIKTALTKSLSKSETKATESSSAKMYTGQAGEINKRVDEFLEPVIDKSDKQDRDSASDIKKKTNR
jgi:Mg-chelatase subunit ChlI